MLRRWTLVAAVALAIVPPPTGSALSPQQPAFRAGVDVVQLDVTVLDRDRQPVRGLTAAHFTIIEDEATEARQIVSFESVELPSRRDSANEPVAAVASDVTSNQHDTQRLIVIVFDDANAGVSAGYGMAYRDPWIMRAGKQIARDVVHGLGPNDLAAVVFTNIGRPQNFTTDRSRLLSAIESFAPQNSPSAGAPMACDYKGPEGNCVLTTLRHVAEALPSSPPRRKVVVFISQGHRLPLTAPTDDDGQLIVPSSEHLREIGYVQDTLRALQRANAAVYAYSPAGVQVRDSGNVEALRGISEHTGGRATVQTNTPWTDVGAMFAETSAYYLLGFETTRTDGRFHPVRVRVNRPDVEVRTRTGYFAPARTAGAPTPGIGDGGLAPVERALAGGLPSAGLSLSAVATASPASGTREADVTVLTRVAVPAATLTAPAPTVELLALAFDRNWRERAADRRRLEITRPAGTPPDAPAEVVSRLRLPPGRYELRVAVESESRAGSVFLDLEVPDFERDALSIAGPMLIPGRYGDDDGTRSQPATVRRAFNRSEPVTMLMHVWQGGRGRPEPISVVERIVDAAGQQAWQRDASLSAAMFAVDRMASYTVPLPLAALAPGEHVLTIDVTRGNRTISRHVRFSVR